MLKDFPSFQKTATQLRLLNEISTQLQSLMSSESCFQEMANILHSHLPSECTRIWKVMSGQICQLEAQAGGRPEVIRLGHLHSHPQGVLALAIQERRPCFQALGQNHALLMNINADAQEKTQAGEFCIPIFNDAQGLLLITFSSSGNSASLGFDLSTLEFIALQLRVYLKNHKLWQDTLSFNKKLQNAVEEKTLELRRAHERILEQQKLLQNENKALKTWGKHDHKCMDIIGRSPSILNTLSMVDNIAPTTATVLIQGESGTGKELIARRLHFKSNRSDMPYVTVNCGALQESLLESELFGHEKGSFTGAVVQKIGLCETADGGTLFLDEIGEMSLGIQAKLLRFLQEGEFYRIGGKKPIRVNVRVISATNKELEHEVKENRFREDLFYRLNTIMLRMPPLRKRKEDIPALIDYFLKKSRFGGSSQQIKWIDPRVIDVLTHYSWPGNIRELQNTIERLKILAENQEIRLEDIPFSIRMPKEKLDTNEFNLDMPLAEIEKGHILRALAYNQGNKTKTAESLGITIKTLYNKLHKYGVIKTPLALDSHEDHPGDTHYNS